MSERVIEQAMAEVRKAEERQFVPLTGPIVPLAGVAIGGAVLVALIITIAADWRWGLDFFHVGGGAFWISVDLFMGFIIGPILGRMEPPARMALIRRLMPKMLVIMPVVVVSTLTAGWQLARNENLLFLSYPQHWWITASFISVGLMSLIAYGVIEPANIVVLMELRKQQPNVALIGKTMRNFIYATATIGVLQLSIVAIMTRIATKW
jgi:hypothetical protein